ncbi:hypothetical protein GOP47_0010151 [Adiantum capillus-veneris]|uniref:Uncharacterized protein n=1 Tax=Adiantum capillus-veneris TaxID=13818 RepID=A0A9D4UU75_ADICA|nr:hypothetical protein GOP47_0010151 [Adiantum capillus-veneris]
MSFLLWSLGHKLIARLAFSSWDGEWTYEPDEKLGDYEEPQEELTESYLSIKEGMLVCDSSPMHDGAVVSKPELGKSVASELDSHNEYCANEGSGEECEKVFVDSCLLDDWEKQTSAEQECAMPKTGFKEMLMHMCWMMGLRARCNAWGL